MEEDVKNAEEQKEDMRLNKLIEKSKLAVGDLVKLKRLDKNCEESYLITKPQDIAGIYYDVRDGICEITNVLSLVFEKDFSAEKDIIAHINRAKELKVKVKPNINEYEKMILMELINNQIEFGTLNFIRDKIVFKFGKIAAVNDEDSAMVTLQILTVSSEGESSKLIIYQNFKESLRINFSKLIELGKEYEIDEIFSGYNVDFSQEGYLVDYSEKAAEDADCLIFKDEEGSNTSDELNIF